jgi:fatty acid elongase 3
LPPSLTAVGFVFFATWDFHADEWGLDSLHVGRCEGELFAAITGCVTLSSYLVLFIFFYIATYKKASTRGRKAIGPKKDQAVTATGRAAETLKSARSRFGQSSIESVESTTKGQWAVARD